MNKNIIILLLGLVGLFSSCEKDGEKITMDKVVAPSIVTIPNLKLERANATNTLEFDLKAVDPGFTASATYFLEACKSGNGFVDVATIYSGSQAGAIEITVAKLNQILLDYLPEDASSSVDFRVRSVLTVDGGNGAPGTGDDLFEYISDVKTSDVTVFGLLRLDLQNSGMAQKIVSPNGDGIYSGLVKLDPAQGFTLLNPETTKTYGGVGGALTESTDGIVIGDLGWYMLTVDINTGGMTYVADPYMIGIIGSATPTGWDSDTDMEYDPATKRWYITIDLVGGQFIKFRMNDGWGWNMGLLEGTTGGLSGDLQQGGVGNDIPVAESGNYTVYFTILSDAAGKYELVKN